MSWFTFANKFQCGLLGALFRLSDERGMKERFYPKVSHTTAFHMVSLLL